MLFRSPMAQACLRVSFSQAGDSLHTLWQRVMVTQVLVDLHVKAPIHITQSRVAIEVLDLHVHLLDERITFALQLWRGVPARVCRPAELPVLKPEELVGVVRTLVLRAHAHHATHGRGRAARSVGALHASGNTVHIVGTLPTHARACGLPQPPMKRLCQGL